jgi:hypothetical protein
MKPFTNIGMGYGLNSITWRGIALISNAMRRGQRLV